MRLEHALKFKSHIAWLDMSARRTFQAKAGFDLALSLVATLLAVLNPFCTIEVCMPSSSRLCRPFGEGAVNGLAAL